MSPTIDILVGRHHAADLRRAAERHHATSTSSADAPAAVVVELRLARPDDARLVQRLADLDDAPELAGPVLIALMGGEAVAALSLDDERIVADPFRLTGGAVALLRLRAAQLPSAQQRRPRRRPRLARRRGAAIVPCGE